MLHDCEPELLATSRLVCFRNVIALNHRNAVLSVGVANDDLLPAEFAVVVNHSEAEGVFAVCLKLCLDHVPRQHAKNHFSILRHDIAFGHLKKVLPIAIALEPSHHLILREDAAEVPRRQINIVEAVAGLARQVVGNLVGPRIELFASSDDIELVQAVLNVETADAYSGVLRILQKAAHANRAVSVFVTSDSTPQIIKIKV